jgi:hypothetical protein
MYSVLRFLSMQKCWATHNLFSSLFNLTSLSMLPCLQKLESLLKLSGMYVSHGLLYDESCGSGSLKAKVSPVDHSGSQWNFRCIPLILSFSKQMELQKSSHIVLF